MRPLDFVILALILAAYWFYRRKRSPWAGSRESQPGRRQNQAKQLLEDQGYRVEAFSVKIPVVINVDGKDSGFEISAPLAASKGTETYAVNITGGDNQGRLNSSQIRSQYLLQQLAFNSDGVLLVDVDKGRIRKINFRLSGRIRPFWRGFLLQACLLILILLGAAWLVYSYIF